MENNISTAIQRAFSFTLRYNKIEVMLSGGSDSDIMLDVLLKTVPKEKMTFVFCDTGIEYQATKTHLEYLENKYNIKIIRVPAKIPVPLGVKKYGQPFLTKYVSEMIERLQRHNFNWVDLPYSELIKKYPKCEIALKWWTNANDPNSRFNISKNYKLKEFMIANPPTFKISNKCCKGAKKDTAKNFEKGKTFDMKCMGIRRDEGGIRSTQYKNCFTPDLSETTQQFRPIFFLTDEDKSSYKIKNNITFSDCYERYKLSRTGCCGCPFGSNFLNEIENAEKFEPKLAKAIKNIFKDSYEYTIKYKEFKSK